MNEKERGRPFFVVSKIYSAGKKGSKLVVTKVNGTYKYRKDIEY